MKPARTHKLTAALTVLALILALAAVIVSFAGGAPRAKRLHTGSAMLSAPDLPQLAFETYPTQEQEKELLDAFPRAESCFEKSEEYAKALTPFFESSTREILSSHGGENQVYSPLNLYMALSMAAEITDGSTRGQILDLLGAADIEGLREQSGDIWLMSSLSEYGSETDLGNSIWLNNCIDYKQETLDILANDHFAESFHGDPGTEEYDALLREWTNEKTRNLLEDSANCLQMDPATVIDLMSTVYFHGSWLDMFHEENNTTLPFHSPDGDEDCTFMHQKWDHRSYYRGEHFGAVTLSFTGMEHMTFILPDEDSSVDQILEEGSDLWAFLASKYEFGAGPTDWPHEAVVELELNMPKFDVSSNNELTDTLKALGLTEMFDHRAGNFDPLMYNDLPTFISQVNHAARVMVDEEGCTAASYVELAAAGAGMPPETTQKVVFTLDRPFIFLIQTRLDMPLFIGVVNHP